MYVLISSKIIFLNPLNIVFYSIDHNRIHAADILHACYYLTTQPIPYFVQTPIENNTNYNGK